MVGLPWLLALAVHLTPTCCATELAVEHTNIRVGSNLLLPSDSTTPRRSGSSAPTSAPTAALTPSPTVTGAVLTVVTLSHLVRFDISVALTGAERLSMITVYQHALDSVGLNGASWSISLSPSTARRAELQYYFTSIGSVTSESAAQRCSTLFFATLLANGLTSFGFSTTVTTQCSNDYAAVVAASKSSENEWYEKQGWPLYVAIAGLVLLLLILIGIFQCSKEDQQDAASSKVAPQQPEIPIPNWESKDWFQEPLEANIVDSSRSEKPEDQKPTRIPPWVTPKKSTRKAPPIPLSVCYTPDEYKRITLAEVPKLDAELIHKAVKEQGKKKIFQKLAANWHPGRFEQRFGGIVERTERQEVLRRVRENFALVTAITRVKPRTAGPSQGRGANNIINAGELPVPKFPRMARRCSISAK
eukprot:TRINITY_DN1523_c0_g1_i1.p1 TRINITY_DN1523_c0_g1~~TRINITY_DN1523_c0_g1_i1.p1  ORF type:complete len:417 (+),score=41.80 TRINITY_DN1523_c0_g1_i1:176-1426(+)